MNEYNIEKLLAIRKKDFILDFSFFDIVKDLERANVLSTGDLDNIKLSPEKERIEKLFFYLIYRKANFYKFLNVLRLKYQWLAAHIELDLQSFIADGQPRDEYFDKIRRLRKEIPKHADLNVHRCAYLWDIKQRLLSLERHEYLVVHGRTSFGKRWIVMDACCNYSVMHQMNGNIFWLDCSKCKTPEAILQQLESLGILATSHEFTLTNYNDINNKILMLTETLRNVFEKHQYKDCLIVLVNVQNYETIRAFDINSKILITTKDKKLMDHLANSTHQVEVISGFTRDESLELFSKVLDKPQDELPEKEAVDLFRICKSNPFIISLVANNLKEYKTNEMIRWNYWKKVLEKYESTTYAEFRKPIEESLKVLDNDCRTLYESLVIFTDNVNIPIKVLALYWGRNETDVEEIVHKLDKKYLLQTNIINGELHCSLHYHYYSYLMYYINATKKQNMHKKLVDSYGIPEALKNRTEPDIVDLPNDHYFHFYIGYHLKESGMKSLFPKLFLDFGFLEQKLRITSLPNTLGDFNQYRDEITGGNFQRAELIEQLSTFFSNIEEIITKSEDTCLLQYALATDNLIREEAIRQARRFTNRVWFDDIDHSIKHRQIVQLPKQPHLVRFIEPNTSLIALNDNSILLTDMSLQYTVEPSVYKGHVHPLKDMQIFLESYFVSLDTGGSIRIWSLKETAVERRRTSQSDEEFRLYARQNIPMNAHNGYLLQTIELPMTQINCFLLHKQGDSSQLRLFLATKTGKILTYQWIDDTEKFDLRNSESFDTHIENINSLLYIPNIYLMAINENGSSGFFSLTSQSNVARTSTLEFPKKGPISVHRLTSSRPPNQSAAQLHIIIVVFYDRIFHISIIPFTNVLSTEVKVIYKSINEQNFITCSTVTGDSNYLILGTKKGIIVLQPENGREILRSSVSDNITCIDVCSHDHPTCKYILISATKSGCSVLNVQAIEIEENCVRWATNRMGSPLNENSMNGKESINAWLLGGQIFDVYQSNGGDDDVIDDEKFILLAADSNMHVHYKTSPNKFSQSIHMELKNSQITAISIAQNASFIGCENGAVYKFGCEQPHITLTGPIRFLKYYEQYNLIVAGSSEHYRISIKNEAFQGLIRKSFVYGDRFIILVKHDCSFDIFDLHQKNLINIEAEKSNLALSGCDVLNETMLITTKSSILHEFRIYKSANAISIRHVKEMEINKASPPIALTISAFGKTLFAIGYEDGIIELYDKTEDKVQLLKQLLSHKGPVHALKFSPNQNSSVVPIILVSISGELCFWNVTHIMNNPMEESKLRLSQRFQRKTSSTSQPKIGASPLSSPTSNKTSNCVTNGHKDVIDSSSAPLTPPPMSSSYSFNKLTHRTNSVTNGHSPDINHSLSNVSISQNENNHCTNSNGIVNNNENPWIGKTGASDKPELLSCIKFVGTSAEKIFANKKFTKFITIDNEGEIYYLNILNLSNRNM